MNKIHSRGGSFSVESELPFAAELDHEKIHTAVSVDISIEPTAHSIRMTAGHTLSSS